MPCFCRVSVVGRLAAAQGSDALLAVQSFEDDADPVLGQVMLAGRAADAAHQILGRRFGGGGGGFLAQFHAPGSYDEPEILHSSTTTFCLKGAAVGQGGGSLRNAVNLAKPAISAIHGFTVGVGLSLALSGHPRVMPYNHDAALPECLFRRAGLFDLPDVTVLGVGAERAVFDALERGIWGRARRGADALEQLGPPRRTRWQVAMAPKHYVPVEEARWQAA